MERATLPSVENWTDLGFSVVALGPNGSVEVMYASNPEATDQSLLNGPIAKEMADSIGKSSVELDDGRAPTVITLFHRGERVAAFCEPQSNEMSEDGIREIVAAVMFAARSVRSNRSAVLDPKEIAYLLKVTEGLSDSEIAEDLGLSLRAVKERKKRVLQDLEASSIAHAVNIATSAGLV